MPANNMISDSTVSAHMCQEVRTPIGVVVVMYIGGTVDVSFEKGLREDYECECDADGMSMTIRPAARG